MSVISSDMAVPNFAVEHHSLWSSVNKNLGSRNVNCSCSFKGDVLPSCDTLWKFQSKFNLLVPKLGKHHRKVILSNSYTRVRTKAFRLHWAFLVSQPVTSLLEKDNDKTLNCTKSDYLVSKEMSEHPLVKSIFFSKDANGANFKGSDLNIASLEREQPIEEPWLLHSSILSPSLARSIDSSLTTKSSERSMIKVQNYFETKENDSVETELYSHSIFKFDPYGASEDSPGSNNRGCDIFKTFSLKNQPVEEPWLIEPYHSQESDSKTSSNDNLFEDDKDNTELINKELNFQLQQVRENILSEEESSAISQKELVPTSILINSSVCTVQRIAVLEDGKLVELLLEPVKNNVLCDSVYIGVVTKLVPHMGGAFVNIGSSRPSLMDIKNNREPFVFPPFRHSKEKEVNMMDEIKDNQIDNDIDQYSNGEYAEHDFDDDDVDLEPHKGHVNGSLSSHNVHSVDESVNSVPSSPSRIVERDLEEANKWGNVRKGTKVIVQVVKEGLGTKGPTLTAYPKLRSRFWVLSTRCSTIGISKKISGVERTRLRVIAKTLQPQGFGLTARTVAAGHSLDELRKDLDGLISTWKEIVENAKSASLAADEGVEGALPVILHRAMGQTLSVVQDYFNEKVNSMVVDSPRTYHEVTNYLQQIAPDLCDRVELYNNRPPLFDEYKIEEEISNMLSKWVSLDNGGYLVIEQTEALVSIDVNGGQCMLGQGTSQENAILDVNLAAAKHIAREIRLRDIGGIIVVDFIDMIDDADKRLVYEEVKKAVERDRSTVKVSELSKNGLMEITRKRVRPSVTFMISEPCTCCHGTGRVEALETSFSKIEHEICRLHAMMDKKSDPEDPKSWPRFVLMVDRFMCNYLTSGKRTRLAILSSSLKVWILLKVARGFTRGAYEVKPLTSDKDNTRKQVAINMLRPNTPSGKVTVFPIKKWKSGRK